MSRLSRGSQDGKQLESQQKATTATDSELKNPEDENSELENSKLRHPEPVLLTENQDYYIEDGKWVFTAIYHLKRGYCCNNLCRHCPYPK